MKQPNYLESKNNLIYYSILIHLKCSASRSIQKEMIRIRIETTNQIHKKPIEGFLPKN